jgi:hypothetical protein
MKNALETIKDNLKYTGVIDLPFTEVELLEHKDGRVYLNIAILLDKSNILNISERLKNKILKSSLVEHVIYDAVDRAVSDKEGDIEELEEKVKELEQKLEVIYERALDKAFT